jgi:hypothetical protein
MVIFRTHPIEFIEKQLSTLKPIKYNRFRWWRRWENAFSSLPKSSSLLQKIRNGDLDFSHYFWQIQYCEHEINEKSKACQDPYKWEEITSVDRLRRRKLIEEFEKDESEKLQTIKTSFTKKFGLSEIDYYLELENFDGTLEQFYFHCLSKFK